MAKILNLLKQRKFIYYGLAGLLVLGVAVFIFRNPQSKEETVVVSHGNFVNQVYVSGKVVAAENVELGFDRGGKITKVYYDVESGATPPFVRSGSPIVKIDAKEAEKEVADARIDLESSKLALAKLQLENSDTNLNADLIKAYEDAFANVTDAFSDLSSVIIGLEDILNESNFSDSTARLSGSRAVTYRDEAEKSYYVAGKAFKDTRTIFRTLDRNSSNAEIEAILEKTYDTAKLFADAVKKLKNLADFLADDRDDAAGYSEAKASLSEYANTVNEHLSSLLSSQNDIVDYREAFPASSLDIKDLELEVRQKENALRDAERTLSDYYIRAPFSGVITKIDAKTGEIASSGTPLVTMMSDGTFQIESFVPEVNIALVKLGAEARVTLDAYGEGEEFKAKVVSIDPAETIRDGVATYKIRLQFEDQDERIKSGMTANVSIILFEKQNVIVVPGGVVYQKAGKNFVKIKSDEDIVEREVVLGDKSSLGQVEIISGLADGEIVILSPNKE